MSIQEIDARLAAETALHQTAKQVRELLDKAAKEIELPDDRSPVEEILAMVGDE